MSYKFNPFTGNLDEVGAGSGAATPGGADTQVQFNDGGALGGDAGLVYDKTTDKLTVAGDIDLDNGGTFSTTLQTVTPTANRTVSIPDATGTIGLVNGPTGSIQFNEAGALNGTSDFSTSLVWNNATTTFTGLKLNVTDTASAANSKLLDLQVGGTSRINASNSSGIPTLEFVAGGTILVDRNSTNGILIGNYAGRNIRLGSSTSILFSSSIPTGGIDLQIKRDQANVLVVTDANAGTGYLKLIPTTVGALTAAATVGAGTKAFVTDSTSTLSSHHGQAVVGGGTDFVPVYSDGTTWRVG